MKKSHTFSIQTISTENTFLPSFPLGKRSGTTAARGELKLSPPCISLSHSLKVGTSRERLGMAGTARNLKHHFDDGLGNESRPAYSLMKGVWL